MTTQHISNVGEEESPVTAPSEKSAKQTQPEMNEAKEDKVLLVEEMAKLSDFDLVKLALAALAILHQRAADVTEVENND